MARILHGHGHVLRRRGSSGDSFRSHAAGGERMLTFDCFVSSNLVSHNALNNTLTSWKVGISQGLIRTTVARCLILSANS